MKSFLAILATASVVSAHATWQDLWVGTEDKTDTCIRMPQSNSPVTDVTSNDIRCNASPSAASTTCSVAGKPNTRQPSIPDRVLTNSCSRRQPYGRDAPAAR